MEKQKTLSESTKLVNKITFIAIIISIVFGILTFLTSIITSNVSADRTSLQKHSAKLKASSDEITYQSQLYSLTGDKKHYDNVVKEVDVSKNMETALNGIEKIGVTKTESALIKSINDLTAELADLENAAFAAVEAGDLKKAQSFILDNNYVSSKLKIDSNIQSFQDSITNRSEKNTILSSTILFIFSTITTFSMVAVLIIISKYSKFINTKVVNPIIVLKDCFIEISKGNLNTTIPVESDNTEIGTLSFAAKETQQMLTTYIEDIKGTLNNMANGDMTGKIERHYMGDFFQIKEAINHILESLRRTLSSISNSASEVSMSAAQMAESSSSISEGACEQAGSIEELTTTINAIHGKIKHNSDNSKNVSIIINETSEKLKNSNNKMNEMLEAMEQISTSSSQISKIISTINTVAFQTNLLAVNTSIEASRAGIHGKQFAVIAEEVRQLADNSASAAKNTSSLIAESLLAVVSGNTLAGETASMLHEIVSDTEKIFTLLDDIIISSNEQAVSTEHITKGMAEISGIVQTNTAAAEEGTAISQELASQAELLTKSVSDFKLE